MELWKITFVVADKSVGHQNDERTKHLFPLN